MNAHQGMIRLATIDDIDWLARTIKGFYGELVDIERCKTYFRSTISRADHIYLRGDMCCGGARYGLPFWAPIGSKPLASDIFFCLNTNRAAAFELIDLMKKIVEWAAKSGCRQVSFTALNGTDISGISKRAGITDPVPSFRAIF